MSRPYTAGVWAKRYERLPRAQKDEVIRKVNRIFAERTRVTRKLDPERDKDLVRLWLRIRDAVMSGGVTIPAVGAGTLATERIVMKVEGSGVDSLDGRSFDLNGYGPARPSPGLGGVAAGVSFGGIDVMLNHGKYPDAVRSLQLALTEGRLIPRVTIRFNSTSLVTTWTMGNVLVEAVRNEGTVFQFTLAPGTFNLSVD